jgi:hypothetical protein
MKKMIILAFVLVTSCNKQNATDSPEKFIQNSKTKNLTILFNVAIEARNESDNKYHYYSSHIFKKNDTLTIPSYEYFDDLIKQDSTYYKDIYKLGEQNFVSETVSVSYARDYSQRLDKIYNELKVINSISIPNRGRFIEFTLSPNCKVYYLEDSKTLTPYWKEHFNNITKVDEKWFYECLKK